MKPRKTQSQISRAEARIQQRRATREGERNGKPLATAAGIEEYQGDGADELEIMQEGGADLLEENQGWSKPQADGADSNDDPLRKFAESLTAPEAGE